jgi:hypothetical protein
MLKYHIQTKKDSSFDCIGEEIDKGIKALHNQEEKFGDKGFGDKLKKRVNKIRNEILESQPQPSSLSSTPPLPPPQPPQFVQFRSKNSITKPLHWNSIKLTEEQVIWKYVEKVNSSDLEAEDFSKSFKQNQNAYKLIGEKIKRQNKVY